MVSFYRLASKVFVYAPLLSLARGSKHFTKK